MSAQNEKPIIFSLGMVEAILNNRKSTTRRVIKPQPIGKLGKNIDNEDVIWYSWKEFRGLGECMLKATLAILCCPYGQVGDRLWVRETLLIGLLNLIYKADDTAIDRYSVANHKVWFLANKGTTVPAIFMPRWASRILLEITRIRVERLQDITLEDVLKEGFKPVCAEADELYCSVRTRIDFAGYWDKLNAKHGFGWESNCWVWVIEFRRIKP